MKLIPDNIAKNIPVYPVAYPDDASADAHVRLFDAETGWEWFLMEYNPETEIGFGLVKGFSVEYGTVSIPELQEAGVQFDPDFEPRDVADIERELVAIKTPEHRAQADSLVSSILEQLNENHPDPEVEFVRIGNVITTMPKGADPEKFAEQYRQYWAKEIHPRLVERMKHWTPEEGGEQ
jgi:hypothetical protein